MNLLYANDAPGVYPASYYAATAAAPPPRPALAGARRADVVIIGAGYTGLSAALHLAEAGFDVAVLDAHRAGWGASGRNGGQLGTGHRLEQGELEARHGRDAARRLWDLAEEAKALARGLIARHGIECDLKPGVIWAVHRARLIDGYRREAERLARDYDYPVRFLPRGEMRATVGSAFYHAGFADAGAGHLHALNYALGLARAAEAAGATIYENSAATAIRRGATVTVETAAGQVTAPHAILACNGYVGDLAPEVAARVMPIHSFVLATEPLGEAGAAALIANDMAVADSLFVVNYFRLSADKRLLFGGGETYGWRFPADIKGFVRKRMLKVFPQLSGARIDYGWGGAVAITMSRMPHLARLGPNILSASGYSGHGVALATLSGKLAAEAVQGQAERFDTLAMLPSRRFPGGAALRHPLLILAMLGAALRDRL